MEWIYKPKTEKQLKDWFRNKVRTNMSGFISYTDFKDWYDNKPKECFYCGLKEEDSQKIVHNGILTSNRFPINGDVKQGVNRAYWLEVDKKDPKDIYSRENCELSCYFCNNDKSDVFNHIQYKEFMKDRLSFLKKLITN
jgi:hypothetical protein